MQLARECILSLCASLCFGVVFHVRGYKLAFAGAGGLLGWLVFRLTAQVFPASEIPRYFFATVSITIFAEVCARVLRTPVSVFLAVALIPLVPGGGIYRTMQYCIRGTTSQALHACISTVGIAGALAMGIVIVSSAARLVLRGRENESGGGKGK